MVRWRAGAPVRDRVLLFGAMRPCFGLATNDRFPASWLDAGARRLASLYLYLTVSLTSVGLLLWLRVYLLS